MTHAKLFLASIKVEFAGRMDRWRVMMQLNEFSVFHFTFWTMKSDKKMVTRKWLARWQKDVNMGKALSQDGFGWLCWRELQCGGEEKEQSERRDVWMSWNCLGPENRFYFGCSLKWASLFFRLFLFLNTVITSMFSEPKEFGANFDYDNDNFYRDGFRWI